MSGEPPRVTLAGNSMTRLVSAIPVIADVRAVAEGGDVEIDDVRLVGDLLGAALGG